MRAIVELSGRDNELIVQVAKDPRAVAIEIARDGAAVQVVDTATILFLTATFAAVSCIKRMETCQLTGV